MPPAPRWLTPSEIRKRTRVHPLRLADIPIESYASLPLPTLRWHNPAYALWIGPKNQGLGKPLLIGAPDRWWVLGATRGRTLIYALWSACAFGTDVPRATAAIPVVSRSDEEHRQRLAHIESQLADLADVYFSSAQGDHEARQSFLMTFADYVPAALVPWYRALTPDFFAWLES
jgi:hypothetical protein